MDPNLIDTKTIQIALLLAIWSFPWKGVALWRAAQRRQIGWFIAMLIINSAAILEIIYLAFFQKENTTEKN